MVKLFFYSCLIDKTFITPGSFNRLSKANQINYWKLVWKFILHLVLTRLRVVYIEITN